jgi:parallel beta-helix repeat protein
MKYFRVLCYLPLLLLFAGEAAQAAPAFTINTVTASSATVVPGQTVTFSAAATASQNAPSELFTFWWYPVGASANTGDSIQSVAFAAGNALSKTASWTVPAGTAPGTYTLTVAIFASNWSAVYATQAITFAVAAATSPPPPPTNGACGASNGKSLASAPTGGLCTAGTASSVTGSGPFYWNCAGSNGGSTAMCQASLLVAVNGKVGSAEGLTFSALTSGSANLCVTGAVGSFTTTALGWTWSCVGANGGTTDKSGYASLIVTQAPGPSAAMFAAPFYSCVRNFYVSPTGNDGQAGTQSSPWRTIQTADSAARQAGDCINVAPGTYSTGVHVTHGGSKASATGYVTYRCQTLDGCKITANGGNGAPAFTINTAGGPNYVVIDGFELAASQQITYGVGILITDNPAGAPIGTPAAHHIWMLNNVIHGYGEAGIGTNEADWIFVLHNTVYNNAQVTCDAQGSGIGLVVAKATPSYAPTAADLAWAPFHQVVAWNITHDNMLTKCGNAASAYDTDGNGIIMDTFNGSGVDNVLYPNQTLVANNVTYNNGGKGIAVFRSSYVTVANNTAYNNNLDPWNSGFPRGEINNAGGVFNVYLNNIVYATPAASPADPRCQGATYASQPAPCPLMANAGLLGGNGAGVVDANNQWANNVSFGGTKLNIWNVDPALTGNYMFDADTLSCTANKCNANPLLANPAGGNFALTTGSPAIGYGQSQPYLPPQDVDAGACTHTLSQCP